MKIISKVALLALLGTTTLVNSNTPALAQDASQQPLEEAAAEEASEEIIVRGVRIPDEKKATSEISSLLDEASFIRTGDTDIGGALGRVTGLSLSEGRFVIVRGLNERYSSVTLDGSPLPSPEPLRRVVPLDIIPTAVLSGTVVQKTFSPEMSAEFGGGAVALRSKAIPEEAYFQIGLSVAYDGVTTGQRGLTYDGGNIDFLGFDDNTRKIPAPLRNNVFAANPTNFDPATQDLVDQSFESRRTTVIFEDQIAPNYDVDLAFGGKLDLSDQIRIGGNVAIGFSNDFQTREGSREQGFTSSAAAAASRPFVLQPGFFPLTAEAGDFTSTQQVADLNGIASFGVELGDNHSIKSTTLLLRSALKDARITRSVRGENSDIELLRENIEFFERQVWQTQLRGEHTFPSLNDLEVTWRGAYGRAYRDAPYQRVTTRGRAAADQDFRLLFDVESVLAVGSLGLTFSEVADRNIDAGIDFKQPFSVFDQSVELKFGYAYTDKVRDTLVRDFVFGVGSVGLPSVVSTSRPDVFYGPSVVGTGVLDVDFVNNPISLDNADSSLFVHAGYIGLETELGPYVRLAAGGRYEYSEQVTTAFATLFPGSSLTATEINENYFLPAVTLTWNPIGNLQMRAGFSQTITRPQFRELTPATFLDDDTDQLIIGNPFLQNTEFDNYDARIEYYFSRGQFVTLGGFYKDISRPIEVTSAQIGGASAQTFVNAPSAELYGFEFEFERVLPIGEWLTRAPFAPETELVLKANYTWSQSSVSANGTVATAVINSATGADLNISPAAGFVVDGRSLQGQSNHLFNMQIGLENPVKNMRATVLANFSSSRIRQTENVITSQPDVFERPPFSLDFVFSRTFNSPAGPFDIGVKVRNILGDRYEATQSFADGTVSQFDVYDLGRELSANITKRF